jgi:hypothetical protein
MGVTKKNIKVGFSVVVLIVALGIFAISAGAGTNKKQRRKKACDAEKRDLNIYRLNRDVEKRDYRFNKTKTNKKAYERAAKEYKKEKTKYERNCKKKKEN